jgi:RNA polymerase sigma-70 factor (ECF subfamily)
MKAELNERLVRDLDQGFEAMVRDYGQRLFAFAYAMSGNAADAEEVAQDAFVRAHRALRGYDSERIRELQVNAWLHRIALNVLRNRVRRRQPRLVPLEAELQVADRGPGPEGQALNRAAMRELARQLSELPTPHRSAVVLRLVQGLSYQEAASLLGQPEGTVKSNVHRGLAALRRRRQLSEVI